MEHVVTTHDKYVAELSRKAQRTASRIEQETRAEKASASKMRKLEYEFGTSKAVSPLRIKSQATYSQAPTHRTERLKLLAGARHVMPFTQPVVISRTLYSADGLRSFTYKLEPIPKVAAPKRLTTGTKVGPGSPGRAVRYVAGKQSRGDYLTGDRIQLNDDGSTLHRSNIDTNNVDKCVEFFDLAERSERVASADRVIVNFARAPWLWRKVIDDPRCDPAVLSAYRKDPTGTIEIELCRGAEALREVLNSCDYRKKLTTKNQKIRDGFDGIKWRLGRGGRTQWRVVVSLPWEFDDAQRLEAMEQVCGLFAKKGCMYFGVIHLPSATNSHKNAHCHIDLYDRPCRRLDGTAADLRNVPKKWRKQVIAEMRNGDFVKDHGKWDFEASRHYRSSSGNKLSHKIFRAAKSPAMREYSLPKESRKDISDVINRIAVRDFGRALYDHRDYRAMKIDKEPDRPLGPDAHSMEGKGGSSEAGSQNEDNHADRARREIHRKYSQRRQELARMEFDLLARTMDHILLGVRLNVRKDAQTAIRSEQKLSELQRDAALLQLEIHRRLSSAYRVIRTSNRIIRLGEDPQGVRAKLRDDARKYWRNWVVENAAEVDLLKSIKVKIDAAADGPSVDELVALAIAPPTPHEVAVAAVRHSEAASRELSPPAIASGIAANVQAEASDVDHADLRGAASRELSTTVDNLTETIASNLADRLHDGDPSPDPLAGSTDREETWMRAASPTVILPADPLLPGLEIAGEVWVPRPSTTSEDRPRVDVSTSPIVSSGKRNIMTKAGASPTLARDDQARFTDASTMRDVEALIPVSVAPMSAAQKETATNRVGFYEISQPVLPTKRMDSLLQQRPGGDPLPAPGRKRFALAKQAPDVAASIGNAPVHLPDRVRAPLIVPPLMVPIEVIGANVFVENDGLARPLHSPVDQANRHIHASSPFGQIATPLASNDLSDHIAPPLLHEEAPSNRRHSVDAPPTEGKPNSKLGRTSAEVPRSPSDDNSILKKEGDGAAAGGRNFVDSAAPPSGSRIVRAPGDPVSATGVANVAGRASWSSTREIAVPKEMPDAGEVEFAGDSFAGAGERMMQAFVDRIEKRHTRLVEVNGVILAAPDQNLERGDAAQIVRSQAALRPVKIRQDALAIEVAKDLWTNAVFLAAGRTDTIDRLSLDLKHRWASDPEIAWALARIGLAPSRATIGASHLAAMQADQGRGMN